MRILLTGGGTGGHIFPILAIVSQIKKISQARGLKEPELLFIGPKTPCLPAGRKSSEGSFKNLEIPCHFILAGKIRRYWSLKNFLDFFKFPIGLVQGLWWIFIWMPDITFGKGGYGSVASVLVSWIYRIPIILHESDAVPGLVNRISGIFANQIIVSFPKAQDYFSSKKTILIGNPVRSGILNGSRELAYQKFRLKPDLPVLFITGGSQGAQRLNEIIIETLPELLKRCQIIHQCGTNNYQWVKKETDLRLNEGQRQSYHLYPFLKDEMKEAYAAADLIISRCGANALAEIAALGKPSILIPLSLAAYDHQKENASYFRKAGAAIVIEEENLRPNLFMGQIFDLLSNPEQRQMMRESAGKLAKPDAAEKIAEEIIKYANK